MPYPLSHITKNEYESGIPDRLMPEDIEASYSYIFRTVALTDENTQGMYAIEIPGSAFETKELASVESGTPSKHVEFHGDIDVPFIPVDLYSYTIFSVDLDAGGFAFRRRVITAEGQPTTEIVQVGYFLGAVSLDNSQIDSTGS